MNAAGILLAGMTIGRQYRPRPSGPYTQCCSAEWCQLRSGSAVCSSKSGTVGRISRGNRRIRAVQSADHLFNYRPMPFCCSTSTPQSQSIWNTKFKVSMTASWNWAAASESCLVHASAWQSRYFADAEWSLPRDRFGQKSLGYDDRREGTRPIVAQFGIPRLRARVRVMDLPENTTEMVDLGDRLPSPKMEGWGRGRLRGVRSEEGDIKQPRLDLVSSIPGTNKQLASSSAD